MLSEVDLSTQLDGKFYILAWFSTLTISQIQGGNLSYTEDCFWKRF